MTMMFPNHLADHLRILRTAASDGLPRSISSDSLDIPFNALRELYEAGYITAAVFNPLSGPRSMLDARITLLGRQYLVELERPPAMHDGAAEPTTSVADQIHNPPESVLKKIAIGVITTVLGAAVIFVLYDYLGIALR